MEISWVKLSVNMFNDEKIKLIRKLPNGDNVLLVWIMLITQAGKCNLNGYIAINRDIPINDETFAALYDLNMQDVRYAFGILSQFKMIDKDENNNIFIINWEKHQNIDGMDKVRKLNAERNRAYRERKKMALTIGNSNDVSVTSRDGTEEDKELDKELDKEKEKNITSFSLEIINYLNFKCETRYKHTSVKTKSLIKARLNEGFTIDDFKQVIDNKHKSWHGTEWQQYLRPETLFGPKFESYLNEKVGVKNAANSEQPKRYSQKGGFDPGF